MKWFSFDKLDKQVWSEVAKFRLPLKNLEDRLRVLRLHAVKIGCPLPEEKDLSSNQFENKSTQAPKKPAGKANSKNKKAPPPNVVNRRLLVYAFAKNYPKLKGKSLDRETCIELDSLKIDIPEHWTAKYNVTNFKQAYKHNEARQRVHKMFSKDRKDPL